MAPEQTRSTDREIGEIVATLKAMEANNNRQFSELSKEMEKLSQQFTEYKADHDKQSAKDYEYLDGKIGKVDHRLQLIEAERVARDTGLLGKFKDKFIAAAASIVAGGIVAFIVWSALTYVKATS